MSTPQDHASSGAHALRRASRLAAVQAIYQMELTGVDAEAVASEFIEHRFEHEPEMKAAGPGDEDFFGAIVRGVPQHQVEIDRSIAKCLAADWRFERVDSILRAILRAGAFELIVRRDVPAKVVIDEYLEISHAFFNKDEPAFVNAVLDKLAHRKRAPEFGEKPPADELQF
ncbi:MAG TPA: transcription antitermination factor NusB [Rhizomicrobium sp.]|jgi:N utilization substance protein B|nr:transcription antitermination factor NusB [Rhizomicrobium sp.]